MGNSEDKLINKIENLIRLSSSDNEHEARAAMMKARELMAKYHIRMEDVSPEEKESETVETATTLEKFRESWIQDLARVIAQNFRCRTLLLHWYTGNTYKIRFLGVNDDAFVCMEIFRYALKVIKSRVKTMRGIFYESGKDFEYNDKLVYCHGFMKGLQINFAEQTKRQQESRRDNCFALALCVPAVVDKAIESMGVEDAAPSTRPSMSRKNSMLYGIGYTDGKAFQNAGDKEQLHS